MEINCEVFTSKLKIYFKKLKLLLLKIIDTISVIVIPVCLILLLVFTLYFISVTATYIAISAGQTPNGLFKSITDYALVLFGIDGQALDNKKYSVIVSILLNTSIMIITTWFAIVPLFTYWKYKSNLRRSSSFNIHPVYDDGKDDIKIMNKYYDGADEITIYSGNFSFLKDDHTMKDIFVSLASAGRIKIVSYKQKAELVSSLGEELYAALASVITSDTNKKIKCSFIKYKASYVFLYKYDYHGLNGREICVCALRDTRDSRYLLNTLETLCQS